MESARTAGEQNVSGVIKVGGHGSQAVGQTNDQNRGQGSQTSARDATDDKPSELSAPTSSRSTTTTTTTIPPAK